MNENNLGLKNCRACGALVAPDADACPRCKTVFADGRRFWREIWGSLLIGLLVVLTTLAVLYGFVGNK